MILVIHGLAQHLLLNISNVYHQVLTLEHAKVTCFNVSELAMSFLKANVTLIIIKTHLAQVWLGQRQVIVNPKPVGKRSLSLISKLADKFFCNRVF